MSHIDREWLEERIAATKTAIVAYEEAILALSTGAQSYSLNTGQTTQSVQKVQLPSLINTLQSLENRLATLNARLCGGSAIVRPGF